MRHDRHQTRPRSATELAELLTTPGLKQAELETAARAASIQQQQLDVDARAGPRRAGAGAPAARGVPSRRSASASPGMQGLLDTFEATKDVEGRDRGGPAALRQGQRLITSDVVWNDLFRLPAEARAGGRGRRRRRGARLDVRRERRALQRALDDARSGSASTAPRRAARRSGCHGTGSSVVRAQPSGQQLSTDTETTIQASTDLALRGRRHQLGRQPGGSASR